MRSFLRAGLAALTLATLAAALGARAGAQEIKAGSLTIVQPWARATPNGATVAGGYLLVRNTGPVPDRLVGGSLALAKGFALHTMTMTDGIMRMRAAEGLDIPAGGELRLDPSSRHIMFTGLARGLKQGETVDGTLVFARAGTVPVRFAVAGMGAASGGAGAAGAAAPHGGMGHAMPGMTMD